MGIGHRTAKSFYYAFSGLATAFKREPNFRIHLVIASVVIVLAFLLRVTIIEFFVLVYTIFFVLLLELLNTMLEAVVNLVSPEIRQEAKVAKDVSAAMVFLAAFLSIVVGSYVFFPKLTSFFL